MRNGILLTILTLIVYDLAIATENIGLPDVRLEKIVTGYSDMHNFGNPTGIFFESKSGEIFLADPGNHQIGIFDAKGTSLWTFKHWVTDSREGRRTLGSPYSVVVTEDGEIIVSDNKADYIDVFDYRGTIIYRIDPDDYPDMPPFRGAPLALDREGNLYIAVKVERSEIIKLDSKYELVMRFGQKGDEPQDFSNISGVWVDADANIFVTDALGTPALKKYNGSGEYLGGFGGRTIDKSDFSLPTGVTITAGGRIWIVDQLRQVVKCLTTEGEFITMIGGFGNGPGDMAYPAAVASDGDSLLIVAEKNGNRFQKFIIK